MSVKTVTVAQALDGLSQFDEVLDARSPAEFALDHLPGAQSWPVLDDEERRIVGTLYVQQGPLPARKVGGPLVARNMASLVQRLAQDKPREWQPLVYCWRGGQRSSALAWFLDQIGFRTTKLDGGYKAFRALVRDQLASRPAAFTFRVLAGRTGSGKTRLLQALAAAGAQVLDLEGLACHRGSVLGGLPGQPQPSQKRFDTLLWQALGALDPQREVYVESESRKIGALQLPDALVACMHASPTLRVEMPDAARVQLLLQDYGFFAQQPDRFCSLLDGLVELRGREQVKAWQALAQGGQWAELYALLIRDHYDPLYLRSIRRHFNDYDQAPEVHLADGQAATLAEAAQRLLQAPRPA
ncbi:tRNA 2-selenouridine synthase [Burkholderiales bacterium JOSHI_001]|nr:tRNA 2-selenouridine synthase [Burkholderiales bacterium JOSHI_001]